MFYRARQVRLGKMVFRYLFTLYLIIHNILFYHLKISKLMFLPSHYYYPSHRVLLSLFILAHVIHNVSTTTITCFSTRLIIIYIYIFFGSINHPARDEQLCALFFLIRLFSREYFFGKIFFTNVYSLVLFDSFVLFTMVTLEFLFSNMKTFKNFLKRCHK